MECTVPVEVHLSLEHADVGSPERGVTAALAQVGQALWAELLERLEGALARPVGLVDAARQGIGRRAGRLHHGLGLGANRLDTHRRRHLNPGAAPAFSSAHH